MLQRENLSKVLLHGFDFFKEIDGKIHYMEDTHKANHHAQVSSSSTACSSTAAAAHSRSSCHSPPTHSLTNTHSHHHAQEEERICMDLVRQRRVAFL